MVGFPAVLKVARALMTSQLDGTQDINSAWVKKVSIYSRKMGSRAIIAPLNLYISESVSVYLLEICIDFWGHSVSFRVVTHTVCFAQSNGKHFDWVELCHPSRWGGGPGFESWRTKTFEATRGALKQECCFQWDTFSCGMSYTTPIIQHASWLFMSGDGWRNEDSWWSRCKPC